MSYPNIIDKLSCNTVEVGRNKDELGKYLIVLCVVQLHKRESDDVLLIRLRPTQSNH